MGVKMTSERLFNSFIPPKKLLYPPKKKFLATPLVLNIRDGTSVLLFYDGSALFR